MLDLQYDRCNRSCSFCPKSDDSVGPDTFNKMERVLIDKLTEDLIKINYNNSIFLKLYQSTNFNVYLFNFFI